MKCVCEYLRVIGVEWVTPSHRNDPLRLQIPITNLVIKYQPFPVSRYVTKIQTRKSLLLILICVLMEVEKRREEKRRGGVTSEWEVKDKKRCAV